MRRLGVRMAPAAPAATTQVRARGLTAIGTAFRVGETAVLKELLFAGIEDKRLIAIHALKQPIARLQGARRGFETEPTLESGKETHGDLLSLWTPACSRQSLGFGSTETQIHILNGLSGRSFDEVVERGNNDHAPSAGVLGNYRYRSSSCEPRSSFEEVLPPEERGQTARVRKNERTPTAAGLSSSVCATSSKGPRGFHAAWEPAVACERKCATDAGDTRPSTVSTSGW